MSTTTGRPIGAPQPPRSPSSRRVPVGLIPTNFLRLYFTRIHGTFNSMESIQVRYEIPRHQHMFLSRAILVTGWQVNRPPHSQELV